MAKKKGLKTSIKNWVLYFVIVFIIAVAMPKVLATALRTKYPMATITSQSMWPTMSRGDLIFMKGIKSSKIKKGQIVVYKMSDKLIIHRVKEVKNDVIITKGDANITEDAPVNKKDILGTAITIFNKPIKIPYVGNFALSLRGQ